MSEELKQKGIEAEQRLKVWEDENDDEDPQEALRELQEQREELRKLHQAGMLSEERLKFHESQLDQGIRYYENTTQALSEKGKRSKVITVRLDDLTLQRLDDLVLASVAQSRSHAASMLINEGINAKFDVFNEVRKHNEEVSMSRQKLQRILESGFGQNKGQ